MCHANHPLYACEEFLGYSIGDRINYVTEKGLCGNCLRAGHGVKDCWYGPCKKCNKKHNSLLHKERFDNSVSQSSTKNTSQVKPQGEASIESTQAHTTHSSAYNATSLNQDDNNNYNTHTLQQVLLSTALVEIADQNNKYHTVRAILDNGSQHSFISESLCKKLNIPMIQSTVQITGIGNCVTQSTQICNVHVKSVINSYSTHMNCLILPCITARLPSLENHHNIHIPDNVKLADPKYYSSNQIDLLIGADTFWQLLCEGLIRLPNGPYLQNTKLGWVISGCVYQSNHNKLNFKNTNNNKRVQCNFSLDNQLRRFWELEEIPHNKKQIISKSDAACESLFINKTTRDDTGRFSVRIPLCESADVLGDSYTTAEKRFLSLERKLQRGPSDYRKMYYDFMSEYLTLGHMTRVSSFESPYYFLPHHGVFRQHSTTTKLRTVFDASAKSDSAPADVDLTKINTQRLSRYQRVEQMRQDFWKRWSKEYIAELQRRNKWQSTKSELIPNTLVLIKEDNLPPLKWRLGRVLETYPGRDGIARVARIKTEAGEIQRDFTRLCPLFQAEETK
nr:uncharacterized protein LOC128679254 [Plodia interpunctella]